MIGPSKSSDEPGYPETTSEYILLNSPGGKNEDPEQLYGYMRQVRSESIVFLSPGRAVA
jgi:hypothetical protein